MTIRPGTVVLLGPQHVKADAGLALHEIGARGPVALITAGWQERESDDAELRAELGVPAVNLTLHARSEALFAEDRELSGAYNQRQGRLRLMQDFYRVRLDHADDAARAISVRHVDPALIEEERAVSLDVIRYLDQDHLERCRALHEAFEARWRPGERETVARHRREIRELCASVGTIVIAGGHVASLLNRMKLFDVASLAATRTIVAWSAGAMALTDRIVLFHDHPPYGKGLAEMLDAGFGLVHSLVVLPDPRMRIRLDDREGIARFARRIAPGTCVALDHGARIVCEGGRIVRAHAHRLGQDGVVEIGWAGA